MSRPRSPSRGLRVFSVVIVSALVLGFFFWPEGEATPAPQSIDSAPAADPKAAPAAEALTPERLRVRVLNSYPHDAEAYTQGLVWQGGNLYESTGLNGRSSVRRVDVASGEVEHRFDLSQEYFGEGLAVAGDRLIQITWKRGAAFSYDLETLQSVAEWSYSGDGWGLCYDGEQFYMTDGSANLTVRSAEDFSLIDTRVITLRGRPQRAVNELECAEGVIYGNVYGSEVIVRIEPTSGVITGVVDARGLLTAEEGAGVDVMNGIAYDPTDRVFYLTGKLWPKMFQVVFESGAAPGGSRP